MGKVVGLTTETPSKWAELLSLYEEGASDVEVCKLLKLTQPKFDKLYSESEPFAAIIDWGRTLSTAWWYETLRKNVKNKTFNTVLFNFAMKNLHGWADKVDTTTNLDTNQSTDKARSELVALLAKLEKDDPSLAKSLKLVKTG